MKSYDMLVSNIVDFKGTAFDRLDVDFSDVINLPIKLLNLSADIVECLNKKIKIVNGNSLPMFETVGELVNYGYDKLSDYFQIVFGAGRSRDALMEVEEKLANFALKLKDTEFTVFDIRLKSLNISATTASWLKEKEKYKTLGDIYLIGSSKLNKVANSSKVSNKKKVATELKELLRRYGVNAEKTKDHVSSEEPSKEGLVKEGKGIFPNILVHVKTKTEKEKEKEAKKNEEKSKVAEEVVAENSFEKALENSLTKNETYVTTYARIKKPKPNKNIKIITKPISAPNPDEIRMFALMPDGKAVNNSDNKEQTSQENETFAVISEEELKIIREKRNQEYFELNKKRAEQKKKEEYEQRLFEDQIIAKERGITVQELREERKAIAAKMNSLHTNLKPSFFGSVTNTYEGGLSEQEKLDLIAKRKVIKSLEEKNKEENVSQKKQQISEQIKQSSKKYKAEKEREKKAIKAKILDPSNIKVPKVTKERQLERQLIVEAAGLGISVEELKKKKRSEAIKKSWEERKAKNPEKYANSKSEEEKEAKLKALEEEAAKRGMTVEQLKKVKTSEAIKQKLADLKNSDPEKYAKFVKERSENRAAARVENLRKNNPEKYKRWLEIRAQKQAREAKKQEEQAQYAAEAKELGISVEEVIAKHKKEKNELRSKKRVETYYKNHPEVLINKQKREAEALALGRKRVETASRRRAKENKIKALEEEAKSLNISVEELKTKKRAEKSMAAAQKRWNNYYSENPNKTKGEKNTKRKQDLEAKALAAGKSVEQYVLDIRRETIAIAIEKRKSNAKQKREEKMAFYEAEAKSRGITVEMVIEEVKLQKSKEISKKRLEKYYKDRPEILAQKLEEQKKLEAEAKELGISIKDLKEKKQKAKSDRHIKLEQEAKERGISVEELIKIKKLERNNIATKKYYDKLHNISPEKRKELNEKKVENDKKREERQKRIEEEKKEAKAQGISYEEYKNNKVKQIRINTAENARKARYAKFNSEEYLSKKQQKEQLKLEKEKAAAEGLGLTIEEHRKLRQENLKEFRRNLLNLARTKRNNKTKKLKPNTINLSLEQVKILENMSGIEFKHLSTEIFNVFGIGKKMMLTLQDMKDYIEVIDVNDLIKYGITNLINYKHDGHITNLNQLRKIEDVLAYYDLKLNGKKLMIKNRKVVRKENLNNKALDVKKVFETLKLDAKNNPQAEVLYPEILNVNGIAEKQDNSAINFNGQFVNRGFGGGAVRLKPVYSEKLLGNEQSSLQHSDKALAVSEADINNAKMRLSWLEAKVNENGAMALKNVSPAFFKKDCAEFAVITEIFNEYLKQKTISFEDNKASNVSEQNYSEFVDAQIQIFNIITEAKRNGTSINEIKINSGEGGNGISSNNSSNKKFYHSSFGWARKDVKVNKFVFNKNSNELETEPELY